MQSLVITGPFRQSLLHTVCLPKLFYVIAHIVQVLVASVLRSHYVRWLIPIRRDLSIMGPTFCIFYAYSPFMESWSTMVLLTRTQNALTTFDQYWRILIFYFVYSYSIGLTQGVPKKTKVSNLYLSTKEYLCCFQGKCTTKKCNCQIQNRVSELNRC